MKKKFALGFSVMVVMSLILTACYTASPQQATCSYVVGDGMSGHDTKIREIVYPGQTGPIMDYTNTVYVPCNGRNYAVNDGTKYNSNGDKVGDQFTLIKATMKSGVKVEIAATAWWTLNQSDQALRDFYTTCYKYTCFSDQDQGGDANFSTKGWNGMLSEAFGPAMEAAARKAAYELNDSVWQTQDPAQYDDLAAKMSDYFKDEIRARFGGFPEDLFCSSGNSQWPDPSKPGEGEFICNPVRFTVEDVSPSKGNVDSGTEAQGQMNAITLSNAKAKYGDAAGFWLGLLDAIEACKGSGASCIFNIGSSSDLPAVNMPVDSAPAVAPEATVAP